MQNSFCIQEGGTGGIINPSSWAGSVLDQPEWLGWSGPGPKKEKKGFFFLWDQAIYLVSEAEKKTWQILPRKKLSKPLIFHDERLAFRPGPIATLAMFI